MIEKLKQQLIKTTQEVLAFDTVKTEAVGDAPFGIGNKNCLEFVLDLGKKMGFETYNCDNYAGHIEYGSGDKIVGVMGHLDVVPVGEGWHYPPFGGVIDNNRLYGRGTMDDKGPMIAALYALYALKQEGFVPSSKIRLIFGCDEETGMDCIKYYTKKQRLPDIAFTPDGDFPIINIEKGIYQFILSLFKLDKDIIDISAGTRVNVVPNKCTAIIVNKKGIDLRIFKKYNISYTIADDRIMLSSEGESAHASKPELGINATFNMFKCLSELYPSDISLKFVATKLCNDNNGQSWGLPLCDQESGMLTHCIGIAGVHDGVLTLEVDIRFPATFTGEYVTNCIKNNIPKGAKISSKIKEPMLVPSNHPLVINLLKAYEKVTGLKGYPKAIGGGTYSRFLPCCVAFGPEFVGDDQVIHMPDEYVDIDRLVTMAKIFYEALKTIS